MHDDLARLVVRLGLQLHAIQPLALVTALVAARHHCVGYHLIGLASTIPHINSITCAMVRELARRIGLMRSFWYPLGY